MPASNPPPTPPLTLGSSASRCWRTSGGCSGVKNPQACMSPAALSTWLRQYSWHSSLSVAAVAEAAPPLRSALACWAFTDSLNLSGRDKARRGERRGARGRLNYWRSRMGGHAMGAASNGFPPALLLHTPHGGAYAMRVEDR